MSTLIENLINKELSLMVEKRRAVRRGRRMNRNVNRRTSGYNRAFGNGDINEKAIDSFIQYLVATREGWTRNPYFWTLTRTVWAAKRIYEFAKTFKTRPKNIEQANTVCCDYFNNHFFPQMFQLCIEKDDIVQPDIYKRLTYILNFLDKAKKCGNKNGWGVVAHNLLVYYTKLRHSWFGKNASK